MEENHEAPTTGSTNFIRQIIDEDLASGKHDFIVTRFPPEPNGCLHIGHIKAICINFGIALDYKGRCHLRFDDTNPTTEETEYVDAIQEDIHWLGYDWGEHLHYASDYFEQLYEYAIQLIRDGKAYVDDQDQETIRSQRGTLTEPGIESPFRNRSTEENLSLFQQMRDGAFEEGSHVLRAKIDMTSPNMNMRDPVIYRIRKVPHHRTGDKWCIYPMYDFTHCLSDAIEGITHSLCSLEFEDHRPLYDWFIDELNTPAKPRQIEFARLNLTYTVMSKRRLLRLVQEGFVDGWDDPRLPTIAGMRRRGYTPEAIRSFVDKVGVAKALSMVDFDLLQHCLRDDLNVRAPRVMVVLDPLKVVITNYPEDKTEMLLAENNPEDESAGHREIPFSRELYVERDDFREDAPRKWFRLAPGKEVRLKHAYYVTCEKVVKDEAGNPIELHCTYDPQTRGGWSNDGRKIKGTLHWVSAKHAKPVSVRMYDHLFTKMNPNETEEGEKFTDFLNPDSLVTIENAMAEPSLCQAAPADRFQFLRKGYFNADPKLFKPDAPVFNRIVPLRDSWARIERNMK